MCYVQFDAVHVFDIVDVVGVIDAVHEIDVVLVTDVVDALAKAVRVVEAFDITQVLYR